MGPIMLDAEAGPVSAEPARRGIAADARLHVVAELATQARMAPHPRAFDWLADEPELYTDADLAAPFGIRRR